jgi:hypothetical protein
MSRLTQYEGCKHRLSGNILLYIHNPYPQTSARKDNFLTKARRKYHNFPKTRLYEEGGYNENGGVMKGSESDTEGNVMRVQKRCGKEIEEFVREVTFRRIEGHVFDAECHALKRTVLKLF